MRPAGVDFQQGPEHALSVWTEVTDDEWREAFVDPYTGRVLGSRAWADLSEGVVNLMPFLYRLHYSLALGDVGILLFGIVALLWTVDCFVGAYLTFPLSDRRVGSTARFSWFRRWLPAWLLRTSRLFSFLFTWHRASGLWLWALLLVFAWSAVGLNLPQVHRPVMSVFGMSASVHDGLPELGRPYPTSKFTLREAHAIGQRLMGEEARRHDFDVKRELYLYHAPEHDAYIYVVESSLDISTKYPGTEVYFSARDGHLIGFEAPTGLRAGNTISSWLVALHFAAVGGLWYRCFVACLGLLVVVLSVTGVWIWWKKRGRRQRGLHPEGTPAAAARKSIAR